MRSATPKVLHELAGRPLINHVLRAASTLAPVTTTVVVGHEADRVRAHLQAWPGVQTVLQEPQLGTGHALLTAESALEGQVGTLVLLSGDVPLLSAASLAALLTRHEESGAAATVVTAMVERPFGYGRVLRAGGEIARIVEERDAAPAEREIKEINAGIYAFALESLFDALRDVGAENAQRESYLPDLVSVYRRQRRIVATWTVANPIEIRGINSQTRAGRSRGGDATAQARGADGRRGHARGPRHNLRRRGRGGRTRHHPAPGRSPRGTHAASERVRNPLGQPAGRRGRGKPGRPCSTIR